MSKSNMKLIRYSNFCSAMKMLCIKMGWEKEYSWYIIGRDVDGCKSGEKDKFIKKATRLLALNYEGIHTGDNPTLSPRLLPRDNPASQPLRFPKEWGENVNP